MTEIAKTYIDSPHLLNPALAVLYAHYAMTGETIDPQQLQEKRHEELQSNDPQSFLLALESLEPYYKLLY